MNFIGIITENFCLTLDETNRRFLINGYVVSKETVVLRRWESETKIWFYQTS